MPTNRWCNKIKKHMQVCIKQVILPVLLKIIPFIDVHAILTRHQYAGQRVGVSTTAPDPQQALKNSSVLPEHLLQLPFCLLKVMNWLMADSDLARRRLQNPTCRDQYPNCLHTRLWAPAERR